MAMKSQERGRIFLEAASKEEVRRKVLDYLLGLFKDVPRESIADLCRKTPVVLIDNVPPSKAKTILADLGRLGAVARFLPGPEPLINPENSPTAIPSPVHVSQKAGSSGPPPILFPASKVRSRRTWIIRMAVYLFLIGTVFLFFPKFFGFSQVQPVYLLQNWYRLVFSPKVDFNAWRPLSLTAPSIMEVRPENMVQAFLDQYRMRPDRRLLQAFEVLTKRYEQLRGRQPKMEKFRVGFITANEHWIKIPLLKKSGIPFIKDRVRKEVTLPLPLTFSQTKAALDEWLAAMAGEEGVYPVPQPITQVDPKLETSLQYINRVDPRFILMGLSVLEEYWQGGRRNGQLLRAAARGYALLLMVLTPDVTQATDPFASEALAFLTLARWTDPLLPLNREEALLAQTMGYRAYSASFPRPKASGTLLLEDSLLDAYLRQDFKTLKGFLDRKERSVLGYYLISRLYREIELRAEAETASLDLLQLFPIVYPGVVENIYSGDLGLAKKLTELYPLDIVSLLEKKVSQKLSPESLSWEERLKGFSGEKQTGDLSFSRFAAMLNQWSPYGPDKNFSFIIDEKRAKRIYQTLYLDAVYLRFHVLLHRWNVIETAKTYVDSQVATDKDHPLTLFMQGQVFSQTGNRNSAEDCFKRVIRHPKAGGVLTCKAFDAFKTPIEKIRFLPRAAAQLDSRPDQRFKMGWLFQKDVHNYDLAHYHYTSGLKEDPYQYGAYYSLAKIEGSADPLLRAIEKFPSSFVLLKLAGEYLSIREDPASKIRALLFFENAQKLAPSNHSIVSQRARVLAELKRYKEAIEILTEWIDRNEKADVLIISSMKSRRAEVYLKIGKPQKALDSLGGTIDPYKAGVMLAASRALEDLGRTGQAAELYQKTVERYPMGISVLAKAAGFYWRNGEDEAAAQVIARGRSMEGLFSQWYFDEFVEVFGQSSKEKLLQAVEALKRQGARLWEIQALALRLAKKGQQEVSFRIISGARGGTLMENFEKTVHTYKLLRQWKGKTEAWHFLQGIVPEDKKPLLLMVLYKNGMSGELLDLIGEPDTYPANHREFIWLQKLMAWQAQNKKPDSLADSFSDHYKKDINDPYHFVGRYLLGLMTQNQLLKKIETPKQRCEFSYYLGLAERLKGNFAGATQWYHLCLETLLENNGEFHWATDELFRWAQLGMEKRHRLLRDDLTGLSGEGGVNN